MDFTTILNDYFVVVVMVACLILGYIIKHATICQKIPNNDIPVILAVIGAIVNVLYGGLSMETIVYGALMGLSSTGFHQAFKKFVESTSESENTVEK